MKIISPKTSEVISFVLYTTLSVTILSNKIFVETNNIFFLKNYNIFFYCYGGEYLAVASTAKIAGQIWNKSLMSSVMKQGCSIKFIIRIHLLMFNSYSELQRIYVVPFSLTRQN